MKLSNNTLKVLKNLATLNPAIVLDKSKEGKTTIKSTNTNKAVIVYAEIVEKLEKDVAIFDLNQFLNIFSSFKEPELTFEDSFLYIKEGNSKVKYLYGNKESVLSPPDFSVICQKLFNADDIPEDKVIVKFSLLEDDFNKVLKTADIMGLEHIKIVTENGKIIMKVLNIDNPSSNTFDVVVGEDSTNENREFTFARSNFKMLSGDYEVFLTDSPLSKFYNKANNYTTLIRQQES